MTLDLMKKRKPTRKPSGRWSASEHDRFLRGFEIYGRKWVEVQKIVKTRTLTQVRSHAQKVLQNTTPE